MKIKKSKFIKTLTIDRSKWMCGTGDGALLDPVTQKMCCLGFMSLDAGFKKSEIEGFNSPHDLSCEFKYSKTRLERLDFLLVKDFNINNSFCCSLMKTNDNRKISNPVREKRLTQKFAKAGVKVKFVGEFKED